MPQVAQVRRILFNDEEIGMGFNTDSGLAVGTALANFTVRPNPVAVGMEVTSSISIINSHEEVMERLGMSFEAQGRYGFYSDAAKAQFANSTNYNSSSTFVVASVVVDMPFTRGVDFEVKGQAQQLLDSNRFDEFKAAFGDSFVRGLQTGGEFYAVVRISSVSTETQSSLAASLQLEANGLLASGSFKSQLEIANRRTSTRSEFTATMYQKAGTGTSIAPTVSVEDVVARFRTFPSIVSESPAAYEAEVATYDTLPLPIPPLEERESFLLALADAREKKLRYLQTRNDLEFAHQNPTFFQDPPAPGLLTAAQAVYTRLINAVVAHAIGLARGEISPPTFFDPATLTPPTAEPDPLPLVRIVAEDRAIIPDFTGVDTIDLDYALRNLETHSFDQILAREAHNPPDDAFEISRATLEFLWLSTTVGGQRVRIRWIDTPTSHAQRHVVIGQSPGAGSELPSGDLVTLTITPAPLQL